MIDRAARDEVILAIEDYLDDRIMAFEFDDRLQQVESRDETVTEVIHAVWGLYDDCKDHKVHLTKPEWDFLQRLLLILHSEAGMSSPGRTRWSWDHALAWLAFVGFIGIAFVVGWGWHLSIWAIPFGIISILISIYRRRRGTEFAPGGIACIPFRSLSQIRRLRRQLPGFKKRGYRAEIEGRKIRSETDDFLHRVFSYSGWVLMGPLVLLVQGFPSAVGCALKAVDR